MPIVAEMRAKPSRDPSQSYITVDQIVEEILELGQGTLLAKVDVKQAYRMVPVHPEDRHLLAVQWEGQTYIDKVLPFGLRSAPLIFTAIADALQWIMTERGVRPVFHYLDDFITLGPPNILPVPGQSRGHHPGLQGYRDPTGGGQRSGSGQCHHIPGYRT